MKICTSERKERAPIRAHQLLVGEVYRLVDTGMCVTVAKGDLVLACATINRCTGDRTGIMGVVLNTGHIIKNTYDTCLFHPYPVDCCIQVKE